MIRKAFFWLLLAATIALWSFSDTLFPAEKVSASSVNVRDGDTMILGGRALRLDGIDAPEYRQLCKDAAGAGWPCGKVARARLETLARPGVNCTVGETDRYGRGIAQCSSPATPDLAEAMVAAGLAIDDGRYAKSQASAKAAKRGIWQGKFDEPAAWRAAHPRED